MVRTFATLLFAFYTLGVLVLPGGDLRVLGDLPEMYRHCKASEHADMTMVDFVTDHLLPFDAMVDHHPPGDEQRPHHPPRHHTGAAPFAPLTRPVLPVMAAHAVIAPQLPPEVADLYHFAPLASVLRPPIA